MGHYNGLPRHSRQTDWNANIPPQCGETIEGGPKDAQSASNKSSPEPSSEGKAADDNTGSTAEDQDVEIRPSSPRKISQDRPRLDKSQSTPAYESVVRESSSFEEKLRDIRLRKQSRVSEEDGDVLVEVPSHSPTPSPILSKLLFFFFPFINESNVILLLFPAEEAPQLPPKPALPPRNKLRASEDDLLADSVSSAASGSLDPAGIQDNDKGADGASSPNEGEDFLIEI